MPVFIASRRGFQTGNFKHKTLPSKSSAYKNQQSKLFSKINANLVVFDLTVANFDKGASSSSTGSHSVLSSVKTNLCFAPMSPC